MADYQKLGLTLWSKFHASLTSPMPTFSTPRSRATKNFIAFLDTPSSLIKNCWRSSSSRISNRKTNSFAALSLNLFSTECHLRADPDLVQRLSEVDFVKVCDKQGRVSMTKLQPTSVVDRSSGIADLYFDNEQVFGSGAYASKGKYYQALRVLGMRRDFDADIAIERIKTYHDRSGKNDDALYEKCGHLLTHLNSSKSQFDFNNEWLRLIRLPAVKASKAVVLPPSECRPISDAQLVEGVLGIVDVHVEPFLATKFGWDSVLDPKVISSRISVIAVTYHHPMYNSLYILCWSISTTSLSVEMVVSILAPYVSEIESKLGQDAWLPGSTKGLWSPDRVFIDRRSRL